MTENNKKNLENNFEMEDPVMLLGEQLGQAENKKLQYVDIELIKNNPDQPRKYFNEEDLEELAASIKQYGVLQPIIVQPKDESFLIIAGERRWRACKMLGIKEMPVIMKNPHSTKDFAAISLIENLQRKNLTITEESHYYQQFLDNTGTTQEELAKTIGKSRSYVANLVRINNLTAKAKIKIDQGIISMGHAKVLVGQEKIDEIIDVIIQKKLNVRETEALIRNIKGGLEQNAKNTNKYEKHSSQDISSIEDMLSNRLGAKTCVKIAHDKGKLLISFNSLEELDKILQKIDSISR